jgi:hypothetical protein
MSEERVPAMKTVLANSELVTFEIPADLLHEFKQNVRIVIKYPGLIGIPVPDTFINPEVGKIGSMREFEPILVPRQMLR